MSQNYLYGFHPIYHLLASQPEMIKTLYIQRDRQDSRMQKMIELAKEHKINLQEKSKQELNQMAGDVIHQGVIADYDSNLQNDDLETILQRTEKPFFLILDGIQDPHNLGACLRSANAFGVTAVIAPKDRAVGLNPTVHKVASGATMTTPFIQVTNLARTIRLLKEHNVWVYGLSQSAEKNVFDMKLDLPVALIFGNEAKGMRELTEKHCDDLMTIPMFGTVDSLNVSVATSIALYEVRRQNIKNFI
jgi:23S rRNA (guanosine2251-2'-O)-methyltransferase